jgi:OmpA-OmpF porin, OOP family
MGASTMSKLKSAMLAIALSLGYAGTAAAEEETGFYAGIGLGQSTIENDEDGIDFDEDDTGFKLFGGYQFNEFIAVELAYINEGEPNDSFTVAGIDVENEVEITQVSATAVGTLPFNEFFGAMGRLGFSYVDASFKQTASGFGTTVDEDDNTTEVSYGLGIWFAPRKDFLLRLEYEMTSAELFDDDIDADTDISLISVSAMYRFGR